MIVRTKNLQGLVGSKIPVKYNGKEIGTAIIGNSDITMIIDGNDAEFKKAFSKDALTGFSFEIAVSNNEKIFRYR